MLSLDHLVIATENLAQGTALLEARLGLPLAPGGTHSAMGTHNSLLSLGPDLYLELIAIDPEAQAPNVPRWYALDAFEGAPRLTHWAARTDDLAAALDASPPGAGTPWALSRGALAWQMAIPETGQTPFAGLYPALLQWSSAHPAPALPDHGLRLTRLTLTSPDAAALRVALPAVTPPETLRVTQGPAPTLTADLSGPHGPITL